MTIVNGLLEYRTLCEMNIKGKYREGQGITPTCKHGLIRNPVSDELLQY